MRAVEFLREKLVQLSGEEKHVYELEGKTLGIIGLGTIGKKVARMAQAFDMKVIYFDILRLNEAEEDAVGARFRLADEVLLLPVVAAPAAR